MSKRASPALISSFSITKKVKQIVEGVYALLRSFLNRLSEGFPEIPAGMEIKLLKKMFTPLNPVKQTREICITIF